MEQHRNSVGPAIRRLRSARALSQQRLSTLCARAGYEVSRSTLAKIEARIRSVSDMELYVIAGALGVRMEQLFPHNFSESLRKGAVAPFHVRRNASVRAH